MYSLIACKSKFATSEQLLHNEKIKPMLQLVVDGILEYQQSQQLSIIISKIWARARINDKWSKLSST